uniref:Uncharacterized protein n=1 Tax=Malurus cyaneus samueli TaxID=2593467 RepID=A0A8C5X1U4_9PASS
MGGWEQLLPRARTLRVRCSSVFLFWGKLCPCLLLRDCFSPSCCPASNEHRGLELCSLLARPRGLCGWTSLHSCALALLHITNNQHSPGSTNNQHSPGSTNNQHSPGSTNNQHSPGSTNSQHSPGSTNNQHSPGSTNNQHSPGSTNNQHSPGSTNNQHSPGSTNNQHSPGSTNNQHSPGSTNNQHSPGSTNSQHSPGRAGWEQGAHGGPSCKAGGPSGSSDV